MCWLIHTHGPIEESHYAFRWLARTAKGDGLVQWNLQSEDLGASHDILDFLVWELVKLVFPCAASCQDILEFCVRELVN